jgi:hypothetical protein
VGTGQLSCASDESSFELLSNRRGDSKADAAAARENDAPRIGSGWKIRRG